MRAMRSAAGRRQLALTGLGALGFVVLYLVVAAVATDFAEFMGISPWWLPSALKFAMLVRLGWRWVPVGFVAELANAVIIYDEAIDAQIILQSALIAGSYLTAALVMKRGSARSQPRL